MAKINDPIPTPVFDETNTQYSNQVDPYQIYDPDKAVSDRTGRRIEGAILAIADAIGTKTGKLSRHFGEQGAFNSNPDNNVIDMSLPGITAEGCDTKARMFYSHAEGLGTVTDGQSQHVFGEYNVYYDNSITPHDRGSYVEIVGNGNKIRRSNARTLDWAGNERLAGSLTLNAGKADEVTLTAAQLTQLLALLNT